MKSGDGAAEDYFGAAVAISGNTAIVGAPRNDINGDADQGAAYIFVRSGRSWTQEDKLKAPTGAAGDFFGGSVAISGDTAIVGACFNDVGGNANQGSVYIFTRSAGVWTQQDKLTAGDGAETICSASLSRLTATRRSFGAHLADAGVNVNQGAAYIFTRSGGGVFSESAKLTAPNAAVGDLFGVSVAIERRNGGDRRQRKNRTRRRGCRRGLCLHAVGRRVDGATKALARHQRPGQLFRRRRGR